MTETSAAIAVLDIGNRADEDNEMETDMQVLRRELGEGFAGVNARIDELRRETTQRIDELGRETTQRIDELRRETTERIDLMRQETTDRMSEARRDTNVRIDALHLRMDELHKVELARIDDSRKETSDNYKALNAGMFDFHRETTARIDTVIAESQRRMDRSDTQFRWLVGLMITSLLATAGLFARAAHML